MTANNCERSQAETVRLLLSFFMSLSLFALAASIIYFTYEMAVLSRQIPDVLVSIDNTTAKVEPVVDEVAEIVELVPLLLKEIEETRKLIPPILEEVALVRKQIPPVLKEVALTRQQVPAVLKEVGAVRGEIPAMLSSADKATAAVVAASREIEATRKIVPGILKEVETTRESIPPIMDRADQLIEKARVAGKEASQGAVTGLFKGIISAPFVLIGDAGKSIAGISDEEARAYTERDFDLIEQSSLELLNQGEEGDQREWENAASGNHGTVRLTEVYTDDYSDNECRTLILTLYEGKQELTSKTRSMCRNDDDKWEFAD